MIFRIFQTITQDHFSEKQHIQFYTDLLLQSNFIKFSILFSLAEKTGYILKTSTKNVCLKSIPFLQEHYFP